MNEIQQKILELKHERNAIILAHNYQLPEVYDVADFVGDSFELAVKASETDAKIIIFCGVHFMAESAKILNPEKKVLLPDPNAGCFLAETITADDLRKRKKELPEAAVVSYVNSNAEIKAESDACCTSANAVKICRKLNTQKILFVPDEHLGSFVAEQVPEKKIILWKGNCYVHALLSVKKIRSAQKKHPEAITLAHPECTQEVRHLADEILGTGGMIRFVKNSTKKEFLIATESGMCGRLRRESPEKKFWSLCGECLNMKKITLKKILNSLEKGEGEIKVPQKTAKKAKSALEKMMELCR